MAARDEFAAYGLAGARIDRIAEKAQANKRSIYVHFGPKEELFDLVAAQALSDVAEHVPFTATDLPTYAGTLFDYLAANPAALRLTIWAGLERPETSAAQKRVYQPMIDMLTKRFGSRAVDVLALVLGLVTSWMSAPPALRAHAKFPPSSKARICAHRARLVTAVGALVEATGARTPPSRQGRHRTP